MVDSLTGFARGLANKGQPARVFDWDKAARLIRQRAATEAEAGLSGDWNYTGGPILRDGKPVPREETYVYLASNWAIPEIEIDGCATPCWRFEADTPGWNEHTYWPDSALSILTGDGPQ